MKQNENSEKSVIQKVAEEMLGRLAKRATACSEELEGAVNRGCRSGSVKIQGYIAGVMESAMKVSGFPEGCVNALIGEERAIEDRIGESDSLNDVLFLHGKQRAIQHVIRELQDLIVDTVQMKDPEPGPEEEDEDPRSYLEDEDGNRTYLDSNDEEEPKGGFTPRTEVGEVPTARFDGTSLETQPKRVLASGNVRSEDVLEWAYRWGDEKIGVDIPVEDAAEYFWHNERRSSSKARSVCNNFLYLMAAKGAIRYTKEGRRIRTFQLMPDWRDRCRRSEKKLDLHVKNIPHFRAEGASKIVFENPDAHKADPDAEKAIAELDIEALSKISREACDGEEG